jgi:adenylate kinase
MDVTVVSGVPGVGSSSVCRAARRRLDDGYELINFGDVMLEAAASRGLVESRNDLATLPVEETRLLQRRAGEYVARRAHMRSVLLNTHLVVRTDQGYLPGMPPEVLADVEPNRLVLVEAGAETVAERRSASDYREHRGGTAREVSFEQDLNRAAATTYAAEAGVPIELVENDAAVEEAGDALAAVVGAGGDS